MLFVSKKKKKTEISNNMKLKGLYNRFIDVVKNFIILEKVYNVLKLFMFNSFAVKSCSLKRGERFAWL